MKHKLTHRAGPPHPTVVPAFAALDEFLDQRLNSSLGPDQKAQTRQGIDHLKRAFMEADIPLQEFIDDDGLCAVYIDQLEKAISPGYLAHLMDICRLIHLSPPITNVFVLLNTAPSGVGKTIRGPVINRDCGIPPSRSRQSGGAKWISRDIWRQAFLYLCTKKLIALDYSRCAVPAHQKDPHDFSTCEYGFPEALLGIYPLSIVPRHTARSIRMNQAIAPEVVHQYRQVVENIPDRRGDATSVAWWHVVRQLAMDPGEGDSVAVGAWRKRMATDEAKAIYKQRAATAETVNADAKQHRGLDKLSVRGRDKALGSACLFAFTYNILRLLTISS